MQTDNKPMRPIRKIIIHCTDTPPSMDIGVDTLREWHVEGRGWADVGYQIIVKRDGTAEPGRPMEQAGAHTRNENFDSIGLALVGGRGVAGKPDFNFTSAQMGTLEAVVRMLLDRHQLTADDVYGHRDFSSKACPCFDAKEWAKTL